MADRVSAHIMIGGTVLRSRYPLLVQAIAHDDAAVDWDGTPFDPTILPVDGPLMLMDHEVANGCFVEIEDICRHLGLHYVRWSGGSVGSFPSVRVIYLGYGEVQKFLTTEDDEQIFGIESIRALGSIEAIEADYDRARKNPPPLVLIDTTPGDAVHSEAVHG